MMQKLLILLVAFGLYLFYCYCLKLICDRTGKEPGILIWIPLLQTFPLLRAADLSYWTFLLMLVPVVQIIPIIKMWARILKTMGRNPWLQILLYLVIPAFFLLPYLAFAGNGKNAEMSPSLEGEIASAAAAE
ncbi:MAG: DUF5684 domain-containing protein [bacterium]